MRPCQVRATRFTEECQKGGGANGRVVSRCKRPREGQAAPICAVQIFRSCSLYAQFFSLVWRLRRGILQMMSGEPANAFSRHGSVMRISQGKGSTRTRTQDKRVPSSRVRRKFPSTRQGHQCPWTIRPRGALISRTFSGRVLRAEHKREHPMYYVYNTCPSHNQRNK